MAYRKMCTMAKEVHMKVKNRVLILVCVIALSNGYGMEERITTLYNGYSREEKEQEMYGATITGDLRSVRLLVKSGVDINTSICRGGTALYYTVSTLLGAVDWHLEVAQWLVAQGADIHARDANGSTIIHGAAIGGCVEIFQWLVRQGADSNAKDDNGSTVLHGAAIGGCVEILKWLVDQRIDINAKDGNGNTPFHFACRNADLNAIEWLLDNGADMHSKNNDDEMAISWAAVDGCLDNMRWLIRNGAHVQEFKAHIANKTLLELQKKYGWRLGQIQNILQKYSDLEKEIKENPTRDNFRLVLEQGYYSIVKILLENYNVQLRKEDIIVVKKLWQKTQDPVYKKIGKILVAYYGPWSFLLKQVGLKLKEAELPIELLDLISSFADNCSLTDRVLIQKS
jgi:Ankyrin repeats (many copies)